MTKLRIAFVANNIHQHGGMERCASELVIRLAQTHEVHVFCDIAEGLPSSIIHHRIQCIPKPFILFFIEFYIKSSRAVNPKDFDVVQTIGGISAYQNFVASHYCQYAWGNVINTIHGASDGINLYHRFMWKLGGYFEKKAITSPDTKGISACSRTIKEDLVRYYGVSSQKIDVIYNAVDSIKFNPINKSMRLQIRKRYSIPEKAVVVLFVGEYRRKGLATVIKALARLKYDNVYLLAVGSGNRSAYIDLAQKQGIGNQCVFADPTKDIEFVFSAADIFAFPSYYEPFGMVITEAMASELPVITTNTVGAADFISHGENGYTIDPNDDASLAAILSDLIHNEEIRLIVGKKAREAVIHHTWDNVAAQTLQLYMRYL
jgi:UDP-glucose:(heptosyl)LPS alpha-1,3-glucosyltransferase